MKKLPLVLVFLGLFSAFSVNLLMSTPSDAQVTKVCKVQPVDTPSIPVPIDPRYGSLQGGPYTARVHKMPTGYTRYYVTNSGAIREIVSQVDLSYFKQNGVQKVRIRVCGDNQNSGSIPYLNFKFSGKLIRVKALGTQNLVFTIPKLGNTTTIQTVLV
jgi:hypothetical protein